MAARRLWPVWLVIGLGLIFEALGVWFAVDAIRFSARSQLANAEVLEVARSERSTGDRGEVSVTFTPTLRYRIDSGELVTSKPRVCSGDYDFAVGDEVAVMYDRGNPSDVRIGGPGALWTFPVIFLLAGGLVLAAGLLVRRMMR